MEWYLPLIWAALILIVISAKATPVLLIGIGGAYLLVKLCRTVTSGI